MNECICLKGVTFDRKYFHSATLLRPKEDAGEKYAGNLTLTVNFIVPNIGGSQGILKTMFLKEATPIETIDLYLMLLEALRNIANRKGPCCPVSPTRADLINELLTGDEKALTAGLVPPDPPPSVLEATEEDTK